MAFNLSIKVEELLQTGGLLKITDESDWSESALTARNLYGVIIQGEYRMSDTPEEVVINSYDPITAIEWLAEAPANGRYSFAVFAFIQKDEVVPAVDDVHIDPADGLLYQWDGTDWGQVDLDIDIKSKAAYVSDVLEVPMLSYAYAYKNVLNLDYIKRVKRDTEHGVEQDKRYYSRTTLDYFTALILSAEYNWSIKLWFHFYQLTENLNRIIESGEID